MPGPFLNVSTWLFSRPTNEDEACLRRVAAHIKAKQVVVNPLCVLTRESH